MKFNDGKLIENYGRPYIIAEVNTSHFGDIGAKEMIQEIKKAGCDCVKFQSGSHIHFMLRVILKRIPFQRDSSKSFQWMKVS